MKYLLLAIASLCIFSSATGLSCYTCADEGNCKENVLTCDVISATAGLTLVLRHKHSLQVIPSTDFKCFKLVVEPTATNTELTLKGCTYATTDVCAGTPYMAEQKACHTCTEDECNGTSRQLGTTGLGLLVAVVLTLWGGYYKQ